MHITITGNLGSGKSTICKILEDKYGFEIYSTGKVQREIARQMNLTTLELNQLMCSDHKYDTMIDDTTAKISRENKDKNIIFDSRLAWNFVEDSFKVFLSVNLNVAAQRVMNDNRGKEEQYSTVQEAKEMLAARANTENKRYKELYNLEYFDFGNYNLVIDSTYTTPEIIASVIMEEAKNYEKLETQMKLNSNNDKLIVNRILMSPINIYNDEITEEEKAKLIDKIREYEKLEYYFETCIPVKKDEDKYTVCSNLDDVKAALLAGLTFIPVEIVK